jgi:hypothetical protein
MAPEDYRLNAERCLGEANRLPGVLLKRGLLDMANAWLQLAYKAETASAVIIDGDEWHATSPPSQCSLPDRAMSPER